MDGQKMSQNQKPMYLFGTFVLCIVIPWDIMTIWPQSTFTINFNLK